MGGRIWVESELGVGTVAHFTLPAAPSPTADADVTGAAAPDDPCVLVCDNDPAVVEELSQLLRAHGYRPIGVTDGALALDARPGRAPASRAPGPDDARHGRRRGPGRAAQLA